VPNAVELKLLFREPKFSSPDCNDHLNALSPFAVELVPITTNPSALIALALLVPAELNAPRFEMVAAALDEEAIIAIAINEHN